MAENNTLKNCEDEKGYGFCDESSKGRVTKAEKRNALLEARYAHRGLHKKPEIPENSMAAFKLAVDEGYGIELDVHLTGDNKLAVIHDAGLKRTAGIDLNIEEITLAEAQRFFLEKSEEVVPDFEDFLRMVDGRVPLIIELKTVGNTAALCERVMEALDNYGNDACKSDYACKAEPGKLAGGGYQGLYCIESFDPTVVKWLKDNRPEVIRGQLAGALRKGGDKNIKKSHDFLLRNLIVNVYGKPDFVAYKYSDIDALPFKLFKGAKFTWTIKTYEDLKRAESKGIAGIFEQFNPKDYESR